MILNLNTETVGVVDKVYRNYHRGIYGLPFHYKEHDSYAGNLAQGENLFISAQSVGSTIGFGHGNQNFSPEELALWLTDCVLPWNYGGHIFISANGSSRCYINQLLLELGSDFSNRIFGMFCSQGHHIEPPGYKGWITALI